MNAVGKLGSYISRSVYIVSGPFHPFGGAVDIIVVKQPDGSFKSSPWYVRFGKFQGVLKAREKLVSVSVNGVEADFHMYLDHKGEAYFLREVDVEGPENLCFTKSHEPDLAKQIDPTAKRPLSRTDSGRSQILGRVFGRKSAKEDDLMSENTDSGVFRTESLERAEIAADLLEVKWATELVYSGRQKYGISRLASQDMSEGNNDSRSVTDTHNSVDSQPLVSSVKDMEPESKLNISTFSNSSSQPLVEKNSSINGEVFQIELDLDGDKPSLVLYEDTVGSSLHKSESSKKDQMLFGDLDDFKEIKARQMEDPISQDCGRDTETEAPVSQIKTELNEFSMPHHFCRSSAEMSALTNLSVTEESLGGKLKSISSEINISAISGSRSAEVGISRSLPNVQIPCSDFDFCGFGGYAEPALHSGDFSSACTFLKQGVLRNVEAEGDNDHQSSMSSILSEDKKESGHLIPGNSSRLLDASSGNWRMWPFSFRRSKSMESSERASRLNTGAKNVNERVNTVQDEVDLPKVVVAKKRKRENTPTSAELASLNLKEGTNIITFTFSTPMLGKQQVDARIHLWNCDTRIVISDVDGTITRSDLLGQFMPMVGVDWSQIGVANLFTAIKENGYHVLFLSARSISQAYNTRQLLFNLKQDGKAMPDGPVVISPDGLFPSLYREVVRRAPHEFKISCLEAIKALFPPDRNPFYAGFGNRDTDEISYLKVGIPKGKIFIINPKGEITVNHRIDRKSYTSFHALVNDMFPLMSSLGQEDYNSWNYWKIPPSAMDM